MANNEETFKDKVQRALDQDDASLAFDLVKELDGLIDTTSESDEKMMNAYKAIRAKLMVVAMRYYSEKKLEDIFENSIVAMLSLPDNIDLKDHIKYRLLTDEFIEDRNALRDKLKSALERSKAVLGRAPIILGADEVNPFVSNWIKLIIAELGNKKATSVQLARFYSQNKSVARLDVLDRDRFKSLIEIYNYLKLRSGDLEGYEDYRAIKTFDGALVIVADGQVLAVDNDDELNRLERLAQKKELSGIQLAELKIRYPRRFSKYYAKKIKLDISFGGQPGMMEERAVQFFKDKEAQYGKMEFKPQRLNAQQIGQVVTGLAKLEKKGLKKFKNNLAQIVNNNEDFVTFMRKPEVSDLVRKEFPNELGDKNKDLINQTMFHPIAIEALLQIILLKNMRLPEDEALWHAFEIVQKFPMMLKDFKTLVTFDVTKNKLVWRY